MAAPAVEEIHEMALPNAEIDWERLDKTKFFLVGAGLFSGISCLLYPLTVVKTRVQVQDRGSATAYKSMADAYRQIFRHEGVRGFYKVRWMSTAIIWILKGFGAGVVRDLSRGLSLFKYESAGKASCFTGGLLLVTQYIGK